MSDEKKSSELIENLIKHWSFWDEHEDFYLKKLAPMLVINPKAGDETERSILSALRPLLSDNEWNNLPQMIAERRATLLHENKIERMRRETLEIVRQEAERLAALKREADRERIRQEKIQKQAEEQRRAAILCELRHRFDSDFLSATHYFFESCADFLTEQDFETKKFAFVKNWLKVNSGNRSNRSGLEQLPDDEQIAAISAVHGHIQVVARAGSGKTTTLVNRVLFLLKHCHIAPTEILILAFNRKAALEVRRRLLALIDKSAESKIATEIDRRLKGAGQKKRINLGDIEAGVIETIASQLKIKLPYVMTFHALAYAIVHPEESLLYNGIDGESQGLRAYPKTTIGSWSVKR